MKNTNLPEWFNELAGVLKPKSWCLLREPAVSIQDIHNNRELDIWVETSSISETIFRLHLINWRLTHGTYTHSKNGALSSSIRLKNITSNSIIEIHTGSLKWRSLIYLDQRFIKPCIFYHDSTPFIGGIALQSILTTRGVLRGHLIGDRLKRAREQWNTLSIKEKNEWLNRTNIFSVKQINTIKNWLDGEKPSPLKMLLYSCKHYCSSYLKLTLILNRIKTIVRKKSPFKRQLIISTYGTDGSGKTTTLKKLDIFLHQTEKNWQIKTLYWGRSRENSALLGYFRDTVNKLIEPNSPTHKDSLSKELPVPNKKFKLTTATACVAYTLDYWYRSIKERCRNTSADQITLTDRGPLDVALMPGPPALNKLATRLAPASDAYILCDAPTEVIHSRKKERTLDEIQRQQSTLKALIGNNVRHLVLNTNNTGSGSTQNVAFFIHCWLTHKQGKVDDGTLKLITSEIM